MFRCKVQPKCTSLRLSTATRTLVLKLTQPTASGKDVIMFWVILIQQEAAYPLCTVWSKLQSFQEIQNTWVEPSLPHLVHHEIIAHCTLYTTHFKLQTSF